MQSKNGKVYTVKQQIGRKPFGPGERSGLKLVPETITGCAGLISNCSRNGSGHFLRPKSAQELLRLKLQRQSHFGRARIDVRQAGQRRAGNDQFEELSSTRLKRALI